MALPVSSSVVWCCVDDDNCTVEVLGNVFVVASVVDFCFPVAVVLANDLRRKAIRERQTNERICQTIGCHSSCCRIYELGKEFIRPKCISIKLCVLDSEQCSYLKAF